MEAQPNKIFAYIPEDDCVGTCSTEYCRPHKKVETEYIRKDALLEKLKKEINSTEGIPDDDFKKGLMLAYGQVEDLIKMQ